MYGNQMAVGGPAAAQASPAAMISLLQKGLGSLSPAERQRLNQAKAMMSTQQFQNALPQVLLPRTERGAQLVSVMLGLGLPLNNPQIRQAYGDLFQRAGTTGGGSVGAPNYLSYGAPTMNGLTTAGVPVGGCGAGGCGIPGNVGVPFRSNDTLVGIQNVVGTRVYGQPTMVGAVPGNVGARLVYGQPTMNGVRGF